MLDLPAIKAQAKAATEGKWEFRVRTGWGPERTWSANGKPIAEMASGAGKMASRKNAIFIAAARTNVPALVEALEALMKAGVTDYSKLTGTNRVDCHFCNGVWRTEEPAKHKSACPLARILEEGNE